MPPGSVATHDRPSPEEPGTDGLLKVWVGRHCLLGDQRGGLGSSGPAFPVVTPPLRSLTVGRRQGGPQCDPRPASADGTTSGGRGELRLVPGASPGWSQRLLSLGAPGRSRCPALPLRRRQRRDPPTPRRRLLSGSSRRRVVRRPRHHSAAQATPPSTTLLLRRSPLDERRHRGPERRQRHDHRRSVRPSMMTIPATDSPRSKVTGRGPRKLLRCAASSASMG